MLLLLSCHTNMTAIKSQQFNIQRTWVTGITPATTPATLRKAMAVEA
jgi:hypothetical protein